MRYILLKIIKAYQFLISPLLGNNCRFYPSCSDYTHQAIQQNGIVKGSFLAVKRLLKCHPFHPGGYDPICKEEKK